MLQKCYNIFITHGVGWKKDRMKFFWVLYSTTQKTNPTQKYHNTKPQTIPSNPTNLPLTIQPHTISSKSLNSVFFTSIEFFDRHIAFHNTPLEIFNAITVQLLTTTRVHFKHLFRMLVSTFLNVYGLPNITHTGITFES